MNSSDLDRLGDFSMLDLFRMEIETQSAILTQGLISLEEDQSSPKLMEELMRAAHSAKGAARIVNRKSAVRVAHAMEDCFVAAQKGQGRIPPDQVDTLLRGIDLLGRIAKVPDDSLPDWELAHEAEISAFVASVATAPRAAPPRGRPRMPLLPRSRNKQNTESADAQRESARKGSENGANQRTGPSVSAPKT